MQRRSSQVNTQLMQLPKNSNPDFWDAGAALLTSCASKPTGRWSFYNIPQKEEDKIINIWISYSWTTEGRNRCRRRSNTQVITAFILTDNVDISAPFWTSHSFAVVSILPVVTTVLCGLNAKQTCKTSQESIKEVFYSTTNCLFFFLIHWPLNPFPPKLNFKPLFSKNTHVHSEHFVHWPQF